MCIETQVPQEETGLKSGKPNAPFRIRPPRVTKKKDTVEQSAAPNRIKSIKFGIASAEEIASNAHIVVNNRDIYDQRDRSQVRGGALDPRLGAIDKNATCETCNQKQELCIGHFGYIRLVLPVFHAGYFKATLKILQMICKFCSRVMLDEDTRQRFLQRLAKSKVKTSIHHDIWEKAKRVKDCLYCGRRNGVVKKTAVLRIMHYPLDNKPPSKKKDEDDEDESEELDENAPFLDPVFEMAAASNPDLKKHLPKSADSLNPMRVLNLFKNITAEDVKLLDMNPAFGRPERLLVQYLPVPPLCIRPSVCSDPAAGSNEDDLTMKAAEIVHMNTVITQLLEKGGTPSNIYESWDHLQYEVARYINSDQPGLPVQQGAGKSLRGVSQRLKGKTGRFRGNLSGKRVDFSGRTVISPDPNLRIDQVGVPIHVAKVLTFPERATKFNMEMLRNLIRNGLQNYPGANHVEFPDGTRKFLKYGNREKLANELVPGTIVERHLLDGDIVLFNRQPSLHRISIMAHQVKISPHRTFRFNECVCAPYNADFDGDEMNLHVPQTQEARTEALELMGVIRNICTPKSGEPLVAATQDFITASYLLTSKNMFMDRAEFSRVAAMVSNAEFTIPLPPPAILKPVEMWTGKQLYSALIQSAARSAGAHSHAVYNPNERFRDTGVLQPGTAYVTTEVAEKGYKKELIPPGEFPGMCPRDTYVYFRGGELMCGQLGKKSLGDGSKNSVLYVLARECGNEAAAFAMNRIARFGARWLADGAFSIGVDDVMPSTSLREAKANYIEESNRRCKEIMLAYDREELELHPGCTARETLEAMLMKELHGLRRKTADACKAGLDVHTNAGLTMALAGSKGSDLNIAQMIACVGQQVIGGKRAPDGFFGRCLPHFELGLGALAPLAKGFVANSFFSGLTGTEFFMHAQSGREGLTDTAVKTAETGYMQRRLVKALEDLSVQYDSTVRSSDGAVVQMCYGDDGLDPLQMETDIGKPVNFERTLDAVTCALKDEVDPVLSPFELDFQGEELVNDLKEDLLDAKLLPNGEKEENKGGLDHCITQVAEFLKKKSKQGNFILRRSQVKEFLRQVQAKTRRAAIEPGTAVGAISAQSIGEPGTQMTLKTFHFAGTTTMSITQGVPRLKEIINASKTISTPVTIAPLVWSRDVKSARIVKGRVESTTLGGVVKHIKEVYRGPYAYISVQLDMKTIDTLQLDITIESVAERIVRHSYSKLRVTRDDVTILRPDKLRVNPFVKETSFGEMNIQNKTKEGRRKSMETHPYHLLQSLKLQLPHVSVCGISSVSRAVISDCSTGSAPEYQLEIPSENIAEVMVTPGVDGTKVSCNHIMAMEKTLGIEGARHSILHEMQTTLGAHGLTVDSHHLKLLADCMTSSGTVLGITRFGIQKMRTSTLMLASFEMTVEHLFHAAIHSKEDQISGVSERIIMGVPIPLGTGLFQLFRQAAEKNTDSAFQRREILLGSCPSFAQ
ncbi:unnamed protein product [Agarophyton chilense]